MSNSLHSESTRRSLEAPMLIEVLDPALQAHLIRGGRVRSYSNGEIIQQRGEAADGFWLIEEGAVMVGQFMRDGEFRAVALLGAGDSYGELAVFSGRPRIVDAVSRGESKVRFIAAKPFLDALGNYPVATRKLLGALSAQLQDTLAQLAGLRRGTNPERLAGLLATMADRAGQVATVRATQQELAELLGVTRATANAALRELERQGLVRRGYGTIEILDAPMMAILAQE
ncbi:Crp/Fnr family transcriptional regulator [Altererythrobacter sp. GH1-8]|uniref:Crp/Fnr family transcriptional regulator n=1 Tax=Altererythrobacter sp. GH1-8 TaxID=3349333 RepID=UPI00374C95D9